MKKFRKNKKSRSGIGVFLFFLTLLALAVTLFAVRQRTSLESSAQSLPPEEFVKTSGRNLMYKGRVMNLKGVNVHNSPWDNGWKGDVDSIQIAEADYQKLAEHGGNHFRFGITYGMWKYDRNNFYAMLDKHIIWARKYGIWILPVTFSTPGDCISSGWGDPCNMRTDTNKQNELIAMWKDIATRYRDEPAIVGYDLLNEPGWAGSWFFSFAQKARNEITSVDPNHLVFVTSGDDAQFWKKLEGDNIVYQVHDYIPMALSHCGGGNYGQPPPDESSWKYTYPGNAPDWDGTLVNWSKSSFAGNGDPRANLRQRLSVDWANTNNVPLYVGEWGAETCFRGLEFYVRDHSELFNEWGINQAYYVWRHTQGRWSLYPASGPLNTWNQALLDAVKIGWQGAMKLNVGGNPAIVPTSTAMPATPTATPRPSPTASPRIIVPTTTPLPTATSTVTMTPMPTPQTNGRLTIVTPLKISRTAVRPGDTISATITYRNGTAKPLAVNRFVIASRPPGGTNYGGPYYDLSPEKGYTVIQPGKQITVKATRTFKNTDPKGTWYAYGTYNIGSTWVDAPANQNISFTVGIDTPASDPAGYPKILTTSNSKMPFEEYRKPEGNTVYIKPLNNTGKEIRYVNWHIWPGPLPKYLDTEQVSPFYLGGMDRNKNPRGYTLPYKPILMNTWVMFTDGTSTSSYLFYR